MHSVGAEISTQSRPRQSSYGGVDFDVDRVRRDFPALQQTVRGKPLVYLDNAATSQTPRSVINAVSQFYELECSNVHRGVHLLSQRATEAYEGARCRVAEWIGAAQPQEIVFTRGTTEAINLVANSYGRKHLRPGDEVLITAMEHHSNIVPWQMLCEQTGAVLRVAPVNDAGMLRLDAFCALLGPRTRIVAVTHVSNALGTINPLQQMIQAAHAVDAVVLVDGAQAVPHLRPDVRALDCDFYAFSGHKFYGPMGIGALYGRRELLDKMPPYQGGGDMILSVSFEKTLYAPVPSKFEAGTPNVSGAIGLAAAIDYVEAIDIDAAARYEAELLGYATAALQRVPGLRIIGTAPEKTAVLSFVMEGAHPHDIGTILDDHGVAIRAGHHCAQPLMACLNVPATARASLAPYNTRHEVDVLVGALHDVRNLLT